MDGGILIDGLALLARELALFAAVGFLVLGTSDLVVDLIWIRLQLQRVLMGVPGARLATLRAPGQPGPLAVFVAAWHEAAVIGPMLRHALAAWPDGDYRIYVGCYPNDPDTLAVVGAIEDPRIRRVIGTRPGPTTKADNLNTMWRALRADEAASGRRYKAIVLHDAEDVVHSAELRLFDGLIERFDLVQLPVLPLIDHKRRGVGAHYVDEFCELHGKEMVVREALGAALPLAGVGCALSRDAMAELAGADDAPFDAASLTEDYEIGLRLHALGHIRAPAGRFRRHGDRDARAFSFALAGCGRAEIALDHGHRFVRLGPARLERRTGGTVDAAARPAGAVRRLAAARRLRDHAGGAAAHGGR